jgi:hypothetical protein
MAKGATNVADPPNVYRERPIPDDADLHGFPPTLFAQFRSPVAL